MKIAFVNPPIIERDQFIAADDCCCSLTSRNILTAMLLACASEAQVASHDVAFIDMAIELEVDLHGFDLIVHPTAWQWHKQIHRRMVEVCGNVRRIALGVTPGYALEFASLVPSAFCVAYSEQETVIGSLPLDVGDLVQWRQKAKGIAWTSGRRKRLAAPLQSSFHLLHGVDFGLVPKRYWPYYKQVSYQVTRGCPYRCTFCMWGGSTVTDPTFRMRPARQVAHDLKLIRDIVKKPIPHLYLICAQLTTDLNWIRTFHAEMKDDPYPYRSNINLAEVTDEKMRLLRESGLTFCAAGLEGLTDRALTVMNKAHDFVQAIEAIKVLEGSGLYYRLHLRAGWGETSADIEEATRNLEVIAPLMKHGQLDLGPLVLYKGTSIADLADYRLEPHPDYDEYCPWMAEAPRREWAIFAAQLARRGLLYRRGLKGWPASFQEEYRRNYTALKEEGQ